MEALQLFFLQEAPQQKTVRDVASVLWEQSGVIALWLGGSLARGTADVFSDIDFRLAVAPSHLAYWETPAFERIFEHCSVVGQQFLRFSDDAYLHHLLLSTGELFDLHVQSADGEPTPETHQVLGCRSDLFARKLVRSQRASPTLESNPPEKELLRGLFIDFWVNSHKHRKVLHRGLDFICIRRIQMERELLLRLWYIQQSSRDYSSARETMHSLSEVVHTVERSHVPQARHILRAPLRNRRELIRAIEENRKVVSELGRQLAQQYGFEYPFALESTVLRSWRDFMGSSLASAEEIG